MEIEERIRARAAELQAYTARNLAALVQIPSLSGEEEAVIHKLVAICEQAGFHEVRIDGLGSLVARFG